MGCFSTFDRFRRQHAEDQSLRAHVARRDSEQFSNETIQKNLGPSQVQLLTKVNSVRNTIESA